jgi:alkyl sulfatase BDS1-like metallo-beta-lactamase superfamily hydrolase
VFGADSLLLGMKTLFVGGRDVELVVTLRLGGSDFTVRVDGSALELERGAAANPNATIECEAATLAGLLWHGGSLAAALDDGSVKIDGSRRTVALFLRLFSG